MRRLGLVFFLPYLFLALTRSAIRMMWDFLPTFAAVFFSSVFFLVMISPYLSPTSKLRLEAKAYLQNQSFQSFVNFLGQIAAQDPALAEKEVEEVLVSEEQKTEVREFIMAQSAVTKELLFWEKIYSAQSTHRDVLLNLATLYEASHQDELATEMRVAAQQLDPNHEAFSQEK